MEIKPLSPRYDVVFKNIFGEQHISVLADFLRSVLDLPADEYQEISVKDPHLLRKHKSGKLGILVLRITTKSGNALHIELQVAPQPSIWKRIQYYNARLLTDQIVSGDDYGKINRAISILISYPVLIEEHKEFHTRFRMYDERTKMCYPDSSEIHVLEVQKAQGAENSPLANWLRFFAAETTEEFEMTAQTNPAIAEAWGVIKYLSADEESRRLAEYEEMARRDEADRQQGAYIKGQEEGRLEGRREGLQEGRQEGIYSVVKNLLRKKMPYDDIADATGLSVEEIERLAADRSQ
jgi:predicted transposase/invertase (TIGR01784 family)